MMYKPMPLRLNIFSISLKIMPYEMLLDSLLKTEIRTQERSKHY